MTHSARPVGSLLVSYSASLAGLTTAQVHACVQRVAKNRFGPVVDTSGVNRTAPGIEGRVPPLDQQVREKLAAVMVDANAYGEAGPDAMPRSLS